MASSSYQGKYVKKIAKPNREVWEGAQRLEACSTGPWGVPRQRLLQRRVQQMPHVWEGLGEQARPLLQQRLQHGLPKVRRFGIQQSCRIQKNPRPDPRRGQRRALRAPGVRLLGMPRSGVPAEAIALVHSEAKTFHRVHVKASSAFVDTSAWV